MHLDEVWQVVEKSQAQNASIHKVAMLSADGASAGSCLYWQQKLNAMYYKGSRMSLLFLEPVRISVCTDASVHSCRDTLISIFYSCQNDVSCYGISQHLWPGKIVSAGNEVAVETEEMERVLARREQSRLATYKLAQALSQQLQLQVGLVLNDFAFLKKITLGDSGQCARSPDTVDGNLTINGSAEIDVIQATYDVPVLCRYACWWTKPVLTWPWPHF